MKRLLDIFFCLIAFIILIIPIVLIACLIKLTSIGPIFYWSNRVGKDNIIFRMPKFRTMSINAPEIESSKLLHPDIYISKLGKILRSFSLDELPQLWSIFVGQMSFVGPRPALFNQFELIELRNKYGIHRLTPGLTGWAQVNGRDNLTLNEKLEYEIEYLLKKNNIFDIYIIILTIFKVILKSGISH